MYKPLSDEASDIGLPNVAAPTIQDLPADAERHCHPRRQLQTPDLPERRVDRRAPADVAHDRADDGLRPVARLPGRQLERRNDSFVADGGAAEVLDDPRRLKGLDL